MRGGALPPALLFAALGLALGCVSRRLWASCFIALLASLLVFAGMSVPANRIEEIFFACWASVVATAGSVYFIRRFDRWATIALAVNVAAWASAVVNVSGSRSDLLKACSWVLIAFPASWLADRGQLIPVKVMSSWIIAIAALAAVLQLLPVTPGYLPDHVE